MKYVLAIICMLFWISSSAAETIGEVSDLRGTASIKRAKTLLNPNLGTDLVMRDTIRTKDGSLKLEFVDETRVDVTEHSRMVIDEFIYDPANPKSNGLSMRATLGAVRYASGQIAKTNRQRVNIRTPSAKVTVRGTDFMMIVDEIGGSMITLLPSCDQSGTCIVGEISVESDVGVVIMNQAFQTTIVPHAGAHPGPSVILDLPENLLRAMLIVRRVSPYTEEVIKQTPPTDILDIDFLAFDELDQDPLVEGIKSIWVTDLDNTTYLDEIWVDELQRLIDEILAKFIDELDVQNQDFFKEKFFGLDPETNIFYDEYDGDYIVRRKEGDRHIFQLKLAFYYGYSIDMIQEGFSEFNYRVGIGSANSISINQSD